MRIAVTSDIHGDPTRCEEAKAIQSVAMIGHQRRRRAAAFSKQRRRTDCLREPCQPCAVLKRSKRVWRPK